MSQDQRYSPESGETRRIRDSVSSLALTATTAATSVSENDTLIIVGIDFGTT